MAAQFAPKSLFFSFYVMMSLVFAFSLKMIFPLPISQWSWESDWLDWLLMSPLLSFSLPFSQLRADRQI